MIVQIAIVVCTSLMMAEAVWVIDRPIQKTGKHDIDVSKYCPYMKNCGNWSHLFCALNPNVLGPFGPACVLTNPVGFLSKSLKLRILLMINQFRSRVALGIETGKDGIKFPRAYGMRKLQWDSELASIAQHRARQCTTSVDYCVASTKFSDVFLITTLGYRDAERNYTTTSKNLAQFVINSFVLNSWYDEKRKVVDPTITPPYMKFWEVIYYQMVHNSLTHMGCGLNTFHAYLSDQDLYAAPVIVCIFSHRVVTGDPVYPTSPAPGSSARCGCPPGTREEKDTCLCIKAPRQALFQKDGQCDESCKRNLIVLPIVSADDAPPDQLPKELANLRSYQTQDSVQRSSSEVSATSVEETSRSRKINGADDLGETESFEDEINLEVVLRELLSEEDEISTDKLETIMDSSDDKIDIKSKFPNITISRKSMFNIDLDDNAFTKKGSKKISGSNNKIFYKDKNRSDVSVYTENKYNERKRKQELEQDNNDDFLNKEVKKEVVPSDYEDESDILRELLDKIKDLPSVNKEIKDNLNEILKTILNKKNTETIDHRNNDEIYVDHNIQKDILVDILKDFTDKKHTRKNNDDVDYNFDNRKDILDDISKVNFNDKKLEKTNRDINIEKPKNTDNGNSFKNKTEILNDILKVYLNTKSLNLNQSTGTTKSQDKSDDNFNKLIKKLNDNIQEYLDKSFVKFNSKEVKRNSDEFNERFEKEPDSKNEDFITSLVDEKAIDANISAKMFNKIKQITNRKKSLFNENRKKALYSDTLLNVKQSSSPETDLIPNDDPEISTKELFESLKIPIEKPQRPQPSIKHELHETDASIDKFVRNKLRKKSNDVKSNMKKYLMDLISKLSSKENDGKFLPIAEVSEEASEETMDSVLEKVVENPVPHRYKSVAQETDSIESRKVNRKDQIKRLQQQLLQRRIEELLFKY